MPIHPEIKAWKEKPVERRLRVLRACVDREIEKNPFQWLMVFDEDDHKNAMKCINSLMTCESPDDVIALSRQNDFYFVCLLDFFEDITTQHLIQIGYEKKDILEMADKIRKGLRD